MRNDRLAQTGDIHGGTARKILDPAAHLSGASGIGTPHCHLPLLAGHGGRADGTVLGHVEDFFGTVAFLRQHLHDRRDDIACLLDEDPVTDPQILARDLLLIVEGRTGDRAAGDSDRLEFGHRREYAAAADLDGDVEEAGRCLLRLVLVGDGPPGGLARGTEPRVLGDEIGLDDGAVGLEREASADLPEFADRRHHPLSIASSPVPGIHGQPPSGQASEEFLHRRGQRLSLGGLEGPESVEDRRELPFGDDIGIQLLERAGRGVARIGKDRQPLLVTLCIDPGKGLLRQIDLAPHLEDPRRLAPQGCRDDADGADIARHLVTGGSVTTGRGTGEAPVLIEEGDRHTVHLRFDRHRDLLAGKKALKALHEVGDLLLRVGVVEALHRNEMRNLGKGPLRPSSDLLCRRVGGEQFRMGPLQIDQLAVKGIILPVADLRLGLLVVETVVMGDPRPQSGNPRFG